MRTAITGVIGLLVGLITGSALFERGPGIEVECIALALVCASAAAFADWRLRCAAPRL